MEGIVNATLVTATDDTPEHYRDLTAQEQADYDKHKAEATKLQGQIKQEEDLLALKASVAMPVVVPGTPGANGGRVTVPAQAREELKPGIMVARIAQSVAIGGFDQRAAANAAEGLYGTEMGQIVDRKSTRLNSRHYC